MGLQPAANHYMCNLCLSYKNYTLRRLDIPLIVLLPQVGHEPAHNNGSGPLP